MKILIGNTGLIGKTLSDDIEFDFVFNSSNIDKFNKIVPNYGNIDLYLACLPATMWMVNKDITRDIQNIINIINNINIRKYKNVFLISTIEIYCESKPNSDELTTPTFSSVGYGSNRYLFELLVKQELKYENIKIFRLPALFGKHLKKNIFFDLMNNHQVDLINTNTTLQWYDLAGLTEDIALYASTDKRTINVNLFSEPIPTKEIIQKVFQIDLENNLEPKEHSFKTIFNESGYIESKESILNKMKEFIDENRS